MVSFLIDFNRIKFTVGKAVTLSALSVFRGFTPQKFPTAFQELINKILLACDYLNAKIDPKSIGLPYFN